MSTPSERGRRAVIAGVATSDYPYLPDMSEHGVHAQAAKRALADAGVGVSEVDGLATTGFFPMYAVGVAEYLGMHPAYVDETNIGGASFEVLVEHAATAVEAGLVDTVLVTYGSVQLSQMGRRLGTGGRNAMPSGPMAFESLWGNTLVGSYALAARRHMHEFGTTAEQMAEVAVTMRAHAAHNPMAQYREPITVEDVVSSRLVADPLHKLDCCVISDGGGACVVTTAERAANLPCKPVYILGAAHGTTHHTNISQMPDLTVTAARETGKTAFRRAGLTPQDVDVAQIYDSFTITVLLTLEDLGFCAKGESGDFVSGGGLGIGGRLPTNTDGGGLSACHPGMRGMFLIVEAVRQLRGEGGATQVPEDPRPPKPRPAPIPDADSAPYWSAALDQKLLVQRCDACGHFQLYGRAVCTECWGDVSWVEASGRGTVASWTVIRQNYSRPFRDWIPYVVALVDLEEGPRLMTNIVGCEPDEVTMGMKVVARFEEVSEVAGIALFEPDGAS